MNARLFLCGEHLMDEGGGRRAKPPPPGCSGGRGECRTMTMMRRKSPLEGAGSRDSAPGER